MPAMLTHDFFGQDAYGDAMQVVDLLTSDQRDAFLLGNQGPDPLFYLFLDPFLPKGCKKLGNVMHHDGPTAELLALRRAVDGLPSDERGVGKAYAAGFLCHYLLDSTMHPFLYFWQFGLSDAGVPGLDRTDEGPVHAEIERDFDEMVLWDHMHQTVNTYRPHERVLRARDEVLGIVGKLYAGFAVPVDCGDEREAVFPMAVKCFRLTQRAFYDPESAKGAVLSTLEMPIMGNRYSLYRAMAHLPRKSDTSDFDNRDHLGWKNPFTGAVSTQSFWDLYGTALRRVQDALELFFSDGFDEAAARQITRGLNFSGEPTD